LKKLENLKIKCKLRFIHDFHLIFFFDLELLENVVIQEVVDDDWDVAEQFLEKLPTSR